jgi:hypothetical protein
VKNDHCRAFSPMSANGQFPCDFHFSFLPNFLFYDSYHLPGGASPNFGF